MELIGDWAERAPCNQVPAEAHARCMAKIETETAGEERKQYRIILNVADDGSPDQVERATRHLREAVSRDPERRW